MQSVHVKRGAGIVCRLQVHRIASEGHGTPCSVLVVLVEYCTCIH